MQDGLLPDGRVGSLPNGALTGPQRVQRHLFVACIVQSPHAVDTPSLKSPIKILQIDLVPQPALTVLGV